MKKISIFIASFLLAFPTFAASLDYEIAAKKLDKSRNNLSPKTGSSSFNFDRENIENLPQGQMTPLNQLLQRAPSVVQNSQNQIHVRGDHSNLQYRINGVMLPEISNGAFGQVLDTHFADNIEFLTGAMPAQYGYRTAGVVDIKTKTGNFYKKNRSEMMVGGNNTAAFNQQIGGSKDNLDYYVSASYLQNSRGIESTSSARNSNHNDTVQDNVFGYFSYLLDEKKRLSLIVSNVNNRFEIPNNSGVAPEYNLSGATADSDFLNERQKESSRFAILSLQGISDAEVDYQISFASRYANLAYKPDFNGGLIFNGISSELDRSNFSNALQGDFSYDLNDKNKLRAGFFANNNRVKNNTDNWVFDLDPITEVQLSNDPRLIEEKSVKNSQFYSLYLQNEWKANEKLTLNYGGRFDVSRSYSNENQLSPRLGMVYDLTKKTKIHAGFARYFTPPPTSAISQTNRQSFDNTSNASESEENSKAKAERTSYYDIGIAHQFSPNLNLAIDGYYKDIKNMIDEHQFGNSLIYTPFNYAKGKVYGLEFKGDYRKENFSSYVNFATQRGYGQNIISGQYLHDQEELDYIKNHDVALDHVQNYTAAIGASYLYKNFKYSADALFGSGLRTGEDNKNTMQSYWQLNGSVARDFVIGDLGKFNLRLSALNLLDEVFQYSNGSGIAISASQYGQRRTFYLTIGKSF